MAAEREASIAEQLKGAHNGLTFLDFIINHPGRTDYPADKIPEGLKDTLRALVPFAINSSFGTPLREAVEQEVQSLSAKGLLETLQDIDKASFIQIYASQDAEGLRNIIQTALQEELPDPSGMSMTDALKEQGITLPEKLTSTFNGVAVTEFKPELITNLTDDQTMSFLHNLSPKWANEVLDGLRKDGDLELFLKDENGNPLEVSELSDDSSPEQIREAIDAAIDARARFQDQTGDLFGFWDPEDYKPNILTAIRDSIATSIQGQIDLSPTQLEEAKKTLEELQQGTPQEVAAKLHDFLKDPKNQDAARILNANMDDIKDFLKDPKNSALLVNLMPDKFAEGAVSGFIGQFRDMIGPDGPLSFLGPMIKSLLDIVEPWAQKFGIDVRFGADQSLAAELDGQDGDTPEAETPAPVSGPETPAPDQRQPDPAVAASPAAAPG